MQYPAFPYKLVMLISVWLLPARAMAQIHYCSWLRGTVELPITPKWQTDGEFQDRMQNGLGNKMPLDEKLLHSFRLWVYYKPSPKLRLAISPFAYFRAYPYLLSIADYDKPASEEYRFSAAAELHEYVISQSFAAVGRIAMEYRLLSNRPTTMRSRYRFGLKYNINKYYGTGAYYELLMTTSNQLNYTGFDNDRIFASINRTLGPRVKAEFGIMYTNRKLKQAGMMQEANVILNITYNIGDKTKG